MTARSSPSARSARKMRIMEQEFVKNMSDESRYYRFMDTLRELTQTMLVRFTQIDYDREMALVATVPNESEPGKELQIGVARYVVNPDGESVEFALAVGDDWQKCGVGRKLMTALIECARMKGYRAVVGDVLSTNSQDVPPDDQPRLHHSPASGRHGRQARGQAADQLISFLLTPAQVRREQYKKGQQKAGQ
jgi:GNAT superfamily N-acetyltransferase